MEELVSKTVFQHIAPAELGGRLQPSRISVIVGTRPEAIKLAPVAHALAALGLAPRLIVSGQHPALDPSEHGLAAFASVELGCPGRENPHRHVREVASATLFELRRSPAELMIVQGDTSTALGGAVGATWAGVPVAHVEAGLRSGDPATPWPEEEYRTRIDALAELLFAPTELAAENLRREGVRGTIAITGNSGIDALLALGAQPAPVATVRAGPPQVLVTCHRRENWAEGLRSVTAAVARLAAAEIADFYVLLPPNAHVSAIMREALADCFNVWLVEPCGHSALVRRMRCADLILSDSGGMQEEAPALGVPLLVLRDRTERPEAIASGNARLVGTSEAAIVAAVSALLADPVERAAMSCPAFPFGDGTASRRIAAIVAEWLGTHDTRNELQA